MRSFESNLAFVRACLAELQDYDRAATLFWTLSTPPPAGSPPFLQMTLGNIVLALDEMRAIETGLTPEDHTALTRVLTEWESRWTSRSAQLENKATREVASRIAQWRTYVTEALGSGDLTDYPANVRPRLCAVRLLEWLGTSCEGSAESLAELERIDTRLNARMQEGPCALGTELAALYPPTALYRFLYRRPRRSEDGE
jgi:hypothetical protein